MQEAESQDQTRRERFTEKLSRLCREVRLHYRRQYVLPSYLQQSRAPFSRAFPFFLALSWPTVGPAFAPFGPIRTRRVETLTFTAAAIRASLWRTLAQERRACE